MISKELFCQTIADIQAQDMRMNEFGDALNKICDTSVVFDVNNLYLTALLRILKEELNDRADIIQWWLYEDVRKCIPARYMKAIPSHRLRVSGRKRKIPVFLSWRSSLSILPGQCAENLSMH